MGIDSVCYLLAQLCRFSVCAKISAARNAICLNMLQLILSALHSLRAYVLFQALSQNLTANIVVTLTAIIAPVVLAVVAVAAINAAVIVAIVRVVAIIAVTVGGDWWRVNLHLVRHL